MTLAEVRGQSDLPRWFESFFTTIRQIQYGTLDIALPDGRVFRAQGSLPGPEGRIDVLNPEFFGRLIRDGELGFGEMYVDGWWSAPALQPLMDVLLLNNEQLGRNFPGAGLVRAYERLRHWLRGNTKRGSRRNIAHHYDLGNEFYALWLDQSMTYSSALFDGAEQPLAEGQEAKYRRICDHIDLKPEAHVLEIGCGWGGFAEYAIRERGATVTGLTLSREQQAYAQRRLFEAGLAERAEIVLRDYRDERGTYDGVASIEMFEAVGERYWPTFFRQLHHRLRPGSVAALQLITIADGLFASYRRSTDFVQKYIFPGGMLPSPSEFSRHAASAGLERVGVEEFGEDYSRTLREWRIQFNEKWSDIARLGFDSRFRRMWDFYLASCAACFAAGTTNVAQVALRRPG